jgi:tetratricopeptide (TPR) repeat protein
MRLRLFSLVLWWGLWALPPAFAAGAAEAILAQANAALAGGQYQAAETLVTSGLSESGLDAPMRGRLLVLRGLAKQAAGSANDALVDFTVALQGGGLQGEERARALFARGLTLDGLGRLQEAVGDYTAALTHAPGAAYALNNRANVYRRQRRFEEAKRDYAAALNAATPSPQYPYFGLGQIAEAQGDAQAARDFYNRALTADPGFQLARERIGAMGPPVEGPAGLPADTGIIILRPPPARGRHAPVNTAPPRRAEEAQVLASSRAPVMTVATPSRSSPPPGRGAPLRPAIVDSSASREALVQLGAWRSEAEARAGWSLAEEMAGETLAGLSPLIVRAEIPGRGVYYRLRVAAEGPVSQFCAVLVKKGLACIAARD